MAKLDYAKAKADIAEIVEIVKTVPEALQQKCFELLFEAAFSTAKAQPEVKAAQEREEAEPEVKAPSDKKLTPNVMAFNRLKTVRGSETDRACASSPNQNCVAKGLEVAIFIGGYQNAERLLDRRLIFVPVDIDPIATKLIAGNLERNTRWGFRHSAARASSRPNHTMSSCRSRGSPLGLGWW